MDDVVEVHLGLGQIFAALQTIFVHNLLLTLLFKVINHRLIQNNFHVVHNCLQDL